LTATASLNVLASFKVIASLTAIASFTASIPALPLPLCGPAYAFGLAVNEVDQAVSLIGGASVAHEL